MLLNRAKRYLEVSTNVAVIVAAALFVGVLVKNQFTQESADPRPVTVRKGSILADIPGADFNRSPRTLILALSTDCRYCTQGIPFYRQLLQVRYQGEHPPGIIAIFSEAEADVEDYKKRHQLEVESVAGVNYRSLDIPYTPSLILIDSNGEILNFWEGKLSEDDEKDVLYALTEQQRGGAVGDSRYATLKRTASVFDDDRFLISIRPEGQPQDAQSRMALRRFVNYFDVDLSGDIYIETQRSIVKYSPDGKVEGSVALPQGARGPFCVDGEGQIYLASAAGVHVYSASLGEKAVIPAAELPYPREGSVLKMDYDVDAKAIYVQVYEPGPASQTLYRIDPERVEARVIHRQQRPVKFSPTYSAGAFDFAIGHQYVYVSDIYDYKIFMYSRQTGDLVRAFEKASTPQAVGERDGHLLNRKMVIGELAGPGQLKNYPPIFHLSFTGSGHLLVWTSKRDVSLRQKVDIYDAEMNFVGVDLKYMHPGISNYVFLNKKVYVPDYGFGRSIRVSSVSPLEVPSKPLALKIFEETFRLLEAGN